MYSSLPWRLKDNYRGAGDVRGGFWPMKSHFSSKKFLFEYIGRMGGLFHLGFTTQDPQWCHHLVNIIQFMFWVVLNLVLIKVMVKVLWVLGPPTLPPRNLIVVLMVIIFFILE